MWGDLNDMGSPGKTFHRTMEESAVSGSVCKCPVIIVIFITSVEASSSSWLVLWWKGMWMGAGECLEGRGGRLARVLFADLPLEWKWLVCVVHFDKRCHLACPNIFAWEIENLTNPRNLFDGAQFVLNKGRGALHRLRHSIHRILQPKRKCESISLDPWLNLNCLLWRKNN